MFTIITSVLNSAKALQATADSIRAQTYSPIQWIVIDGHSTDGTQTIIKNNLDIISYWVSERDAGVYDAWNKAVPAIQQEWVVFLGAGDTFCSAQSLAHVSECLSRVSPEILIAYGNVSLVDESGKTRYIERKPTLSGFEFGRPCMPPHQAVFHRKSLFKQTPYKNGLEYFDSSYKINADSKFILEKWRPECVTYFDINVTNKVHAGLSTQPRYQWLSRSEFRRIEKELNLSIPFWHKLQFDTILLVKIILHSILPKSTKSRIAAHLDRVRQRRFAQAEVMHHIS